MKLAWIAAIVLASTVCFTPLCKAEMSPADITTSAQNENPSAITPPTSSKEIAANYQARENERPNGDTPAQWILVIVTTITAAFICWQAWETRKASKAAADSVEIVRKQVSFMEQQTTAAVVAASATQRSADAAKASVDVLVASERAWIDGEVVSSTVLSAYRCSLKITNLGKTPAQIRSYQISTGPLVEGSPFAPAGLSGQNTRSLHLFLGSGDTETLEERIDMDEMFSNSADEFTWGTKCAFCVKIKYADVVTGTPEDRPEHETTFVYLYTPLLHSIERLSVYNKYT